jgi:hypothetical protein
MLQKLGLLAISKQQTIPNVSKDVSIVTSCLRSFGIKISVPKNPKTVPPIFGFFIFFFSRHALLRYSIFEFKNY